MASSTISSELIINLKEDATKQAPRIAAALERVQKQAGALEKALTGTGTSDRLLKSLAKLGAEDTHVEGVAKAWRDYAQAEGLAERAGDWTRQQAAAARSWEDAAVKAVRDVKKEEAALARARHEQTARAESEAIKAARHQAAEEKRLADESARDVVRAAERAAAEQRQLRRESERDDRRAAESTARERRRIGREEAREERDRLKALSREEREAARERERLAHDNAHRSDTVAGVATLYAAHSAVHAAERVLDRYGEYDSERRYGKVVMGLTDEQQRPLIDQAIHGSANSRYNDVQWLAAQRNLAARGYNREQVLGFTPVTAQIGQAFDLEKQEDAVKLLEGAMLGFKKDVSTKDAARASAQRTADLEVKSSKISGMGAEDIEALYKRGAAAARMAGLTEEQMLAFGGAAKKVNIGGDESATAFVSLTKNLLHPTQGALTAMRASGIDFSKYQKIGPVNEEGFASEVARSYGVKLKSGVRAGLHRIFADPELMKDPAKRTPAIMRLLRRDLHGNDAKSMKSIAGLAGRYVDASATGVDTQGLLKAIMDGLAKNPGLAIALFGSKQAGRIASGLDNDVFNHLLDELKNHSQGYGQKVSDDRMAGFKGAMLKLGNQVTILETSVGRAFDNDGKAGGGFLTHATEGVGKFVEILGEANPGLLRAGSEAVALAAGLAALKTVDYFRGGFGFKASAGALTGSAALLDGSAAALDRAAIALGAASVAKGVPGAAKSAAGAVEGAAAGAAAGAATKAAGVAEGAAAKVGVAAAAAAAGGAALGAGGRMAATRAALAVGGRVAMRAIPGVGEILIANDVVKAAVDITANAIGLKKNAEELVEYEKKAGDPVLHPVMAAEHLWAHIRGKYTKEEIDIHDRVRAAAAAPTAPPKVPTEAPDDDAADDATEDGKRSGAPAEKAVSPFLARHPDFRRSDDASPDDAGPPIAGARASGGPVSRGKTYLVGEHGPELFTPGLSGAISTHDVQRLLARGSFAPRADAGDAETAKAVRSMSFALEGALDRVAMAVTRAAQDRPTIGGDFRGDTPFYGREGGGGHPHDFGGGGRRGFMEGGHGGDGPGRRGFAKRAAEGPSEDIPADGDSVKVATELLKRREGFQGTAKWDRNHLRLGFGSDTITDAKGGVHEVKAGDHVTREDAERDLARRIPEFQRRVAREVGVESWKKLSPVVQGALTSMAYNYGGFSKLPSMRAAIASGDKDKIAAAIRQRTGDNGGINAERREGEARMIERAEARHPDAAPPVKPVAGGVGERLASFKHAGVLSNEQCVELARRFVGDSGRVSTWRPGEKADAGTLKPGTPVATFLNARGGEVDRYADGTGGRPKRGLDHAAVFEDYERDRDGKITGMRVAEQYAGSGGVHDKVYPFHSGKFGEHDGSSYRAVKRADGSYLGGRNNPMSAAEPEPAPAKDAAKETTRDAPERPAKDQAGGPADADAGKVVGDLSDRSTYARKGEQIDYKALVVHHTGSRGTPEQIVDTLNKRQLGVQYVMDRDGHIVRSLPEGARAAHILPSEVKGLPLNNGNTEGIEVIAKDDADVTKAQVAAMKRFYADQKKLHPGLQVFGHGYLNPSHKQATEGKTIVDAIRAQNDEKPDAPRDPIEMARAAAKQTPLERRTLGGYMGRDPTPAAVAQDDPLGLRRSRDAAAKDVDKPAGELHAGLAGLHGKSIKPDVDISGIHEAQAAVDHLHESLARVHSASAKSRSRSHEAAKVAGLSSKLRGGFMHSGSSIG